MSADPATKDGISDFLSRHCMHVWSFPEPIDIENDGSRLNVLIWQDFVATRTGTTCGSDYASHPWTEPYVDQRVFIVSADGKTIDEQRTRTIFGAPDESSPARLTRRPSKAPFCHRGRIRSGRSRIRSASSDIKADTISKRRINRRARTDRCLGGGLPAGAQPHREALHVSPDRRASADRLNGKPHRRDTSKAQDTSMSDNNAASNLPAFASITLTPLQSSQTLFSAAASVIRHKSNGNELAGISKRRFYDAQLFGLFSNPAAPSLGEVVQPYEMLTANRGTFIQYEALYGVDPDGNGQAVPNDGIDAANSPSGYNLSCSAQVQTQEQAFANAAPVLLGPRRLARSQFRLVLSITRVIGLAILLVSAALPRLTRAQECCSIQTASTSSVRTLETICGPLHRWPEGISTPTKITDDLILAPPLAYVRYAFLTCKDAVQIISSNGLGKSRWVNFDFFLPDFTGYTIDRFKERYDVNEVEVAYVIAGDRREAEPDAPGKYPPNQLKRALLYLADPKRYQEMYGLRCYQARILKTTMYCYGVRDEARHEGVFSM